MSRNNSLHEEGGVCLWLHHNLELNDVGLWHLGSNKLHRRNLNDLVRPWTCGILNYNLHLIGWVCLVALCIVWELLRSLLWLERRFQLPLCVHYVSEVMARWLVSISCCEGWGNMLCFSFQREQRILIWVVIYWRFLVLCLRQWLGSDSLGER